MIFQNFTCMPLADIYLPLSRSKDLCDTHRMANQQLYSVSLSEMQKSFAVLIELFLVFILIKHECDCNIPIFLLNSFGDVFVECYHNTLTKFEFWTSLDSRVYRTRTTIETYRVFIRTIPFVDRQARNCDNQFSEDFCPIWNRTPGLSFQKKALHSLSFLKTLVFLMGEI